MNLLALNHKRVGYGAIALFVLSVLANDGVRNTIVATALHPSVQAVSTGVGALAAFSLAYFAKPATVPSDPDPAK